MLLVDDESIHECRKPFDRYFFAPVQRGYYLKEVEKPGYYNDEIMEKILNSALKLKTKSRKIIIKRF